MRDRQMLRDDLCVKGSDSMNRFIQKEKLGKKARRKLDALRRRTWEICPATKTFESKKYYNRKRKSCEYPDEWSRRIFVLPVILAII